MPHNNLGWGLIELGQVEDGINEIKASLNLNPNYDNAHNNLGYAYLKQGRDEEAMVEFKTTIEINPNYTNAHGNLAAIYFRTGKYREAAAHAEVLTRLKPEDGGTFAMLGGAYMNLGEHLKAIPAFQQAVTLIPKILVIGKVWASRKWPPGSARTVSVHSNSYCRLGRKIMTRSSCSELLTTRPLVMTMR